jgi:hypothetical protein
LSMYSHCHVVMLGSCPGMRIPIQVPPCHSGQTHRTKDHLTFDAITPHKPKQLKRR